MACIIIESMDFITKISDYYRENFDTLSDDKKFHFATRMSAWFDDDFSNTYIEECRDKYIKSDKDIKIDLEDLLLNPPSAKINAAELREPFFNKYPDLRGLMLALFRVRHLLYVYNYDARHILKGLYPLSKMQKLVDDLSKDKDALRILSTYAINTIYLVDEILYKSDDRKIDVRYFIETGSEMSLDKPEDIQLLIYFYTHCIIGASNFYTNEVSSRDLSLYKDMVIALDGIIKDNFNIVNLDNKFELLVCARITNTSTAIEPLVYEEAKQSISGDGFFTVDTVNSYKQSNKTSLSDSEHRNVLLIMSSSDYEPKESK